MKREFPSLLRAHRARRRWSQEVLALEAGVSPRHLSCLETGKAGPSREMVLQLARVLGLELREQNALLLAAGFAAVYPVTPLGSEALGPVARAIDFVLAQHEPYPCLLVDRCFNVLRSNQGAGALLRAFLDLGSIPPAVAHNLVRAALHPEGIRPYVVGWDGVSAVVVARLERAHAAHPGDAERGALLEEVLSYPGVAASRGLAAPDGGPAALLHLRRGDVDLRVFTLLTSVGTPLDVTAEELTLESLFPADDATARWFRTHVSR